MTHVSPHPTRRCSNCAHLESGIGCLQVVVIGDGGGKPRGFACHEHQTTGELALEIHRVEHLALFQEVA